MWFALSMLLLFVGWCWYDSCRAPFLDGSESSNASDDAAQQRADLMDFLDETSRTKTEDYQVWHDMGLMTPDHVLPTNNHDLGSTT